MLGYILSAFLMFVLLGIVLGTLDGINSLKEVNYEKTN